MLLLCRGHPRASPSLAKLLRGLSGGVYERPINDFLRLFSASTSASVITPRLLSPSGIHE